MKVKAFTYNMFGVNTYVVYDPGTLEAAIVDPGMIDRREERVLVDFIKENNLRPVHLINTHLHIDHTFGDDFVTATYGLKLEANGGDRRFGEHRDIQARGFGLPLSPEPIEIDVELNDGDRVYIGNKTLEVMTVPGHSPGSIVLYDREEGWIISGDVLFHGSIGRTDLAGGNHQQLIEEIHKKLLTLPDDTVVYPGHGPATTIGRERLCNMFLGIKHTL